ncbi:hypothetical protein EVAR_53440_1 [Eumeta japonica]|uniref:Uncharacterized protein n=1 Tax=Eumeta variegata TaxID=151549 RepID=A0A4C1Y1V2_EUMVA|nr:hypothetical protein EVAR_53440_1 [Eumeta japonica]
MSSDARLNRIINAKSSFIANETKNRIASRDRMRTESRTEPWLESSVELKLEARACSKSEIRAGLLNPNLLNHEVLADSLGIPVHGFVTGILIPGPLMLPMSSALEVAFVRTYSNGTFSSRSYTLSVGPFERRIKTFHEFRARRAR